MHKSLNKWEKLIQTISKRPQFLKNNYFWYGIEGIIDIHL
jgi:hypothetical protein